MYVFVLQKTSSVTSYYNNMARPVIKQPCTTLKVNMLTHTPSTMRSLELCTKPQHSIHCQLPQHNLKDTTCNNLLCFIVHRPGARSAASIILRGANDFMVDEMERSIHDALCVVKRVLESNRVVPGGGAVETALSIFLENFATSIVSFSCLSMFFSHNNTLP